MFRKLLQKYASTRIVKLNSVNSACRRWYAKEDDCPPCPKKSPRYPIRAKQIKEKKCSPCGYQFQLRKPEKEQLTEEKRQKTQCDKPCPPDTQKMVNDCPKKSPTECPKGDWEVAKDK